MSHTSKVNSFTFLKCLLILTLFCLALYLCPYVLHSKFIRTNIDTFSPNYTISPSATTQQVCLLASDMVTMCLSCGQQHLGQKEAHHLHLGPVNASHEIPNFCSSPCLRSAGETEGVFVPSGETEES